MTYLHNSQEACRYVQDRNCDFFSRHKPEAGVPPLEARQVHHTIFFGVQLRIVDNNS